ncbi:hypothetical protein [Halomicrobium urmianum]|uniref:hypothetical protein n=1 Tax=Halomicrobium urmianum TaxID=1586233 RepID=UPI001CDA0AF8|nr:hypothetical protein [Halomicrobium urmianum]
MGRDTSGLAISLLGLAVFVVGVGLLIDLTYFETAPALQAREGLGLLTPNLVVGGYGLMEAGRYHGTAGGSEESRYFDTRLPVFSGRDSTAVELSPSNATALWFRVLWIGLTGQAVWAGLALTGLVEGVSGRVLRYATLLATVLAAYYDMQYVAGRARWSGPQRWLLGFAVFPVNLGVAVAYVRLRRRRLTGAGSSCGDGDVAGPTGGIDRSWAAPGWHYVVALATVSWLPILLVGDVAVSTGPLVAVVIVAVWSALPVAIALDSRQFVDSDWAPKRRRWILGSLIPVCNLVVGPAYLLRRYETTR